jgi:hypothetical protein
VVLRYTETGRTHLEAGSVPGRSRISVVIPARNEALNIAWVLENMPLDVDEVILVDGRSTDRTVEVALAIRPDTVVVVDDAPGKGCAIRKGIETATGEFVVMLDADGSMDPREIDRFIQPLRDGHDLVRGSRFMPGGGTADMSPLRDVGNRGLMILTRILYRTSRSDLCYGYAAFRRSSVLSLGLTATGFEIEAQLFLRAERARLKVTEVPSFEAPRRAGTSNLHAFRDGRRVLRTIIGERLRSQSRLGAGMTMPERLGAASPVRRLRPRAAVAINIEASPDLRAATEPSPRGFAAWSAPWRKFVRLTEGREARISATRTGHERAMAAALAWSLAVKHGDDRLRAVALADYRDARRKAADDLPLPCNLRLLELRQELITLRA